MAAGGIAALFLWASAALATDQAPNPAVPADVRLDPAREAIVAVIRDADRAGVPAELVTAKIQEGLAKRVPAERIAIAARSLNDQLIQAKAAMAKQGRMSASVPLYRALAEAQMAGYSAPELGPLVKSEIAEATAVRAVQVATDLGVRGYPRKDALKLVQAMVSKDSAALPRVATAVERLRREYALSPVDAIGTLQRGLAVNASLDGALEAASGDAARRISPEGRARGQETGEGNPGNGFGLGAGKGKAKGLRK